MDAEACRMSSGAAAARHNPRSEPATWSLVVHESAEGAARGGPQRSLVAADARQRFVEAIGAPKDVVEAHHAQDAAGRLLGTDERCNTVVAPDAPADVPQGAYAD